MFGSMFKAAKSAASTASTSAKSASSSVDDGADGLRVDAPETIFDQYRGNQAEIAGTGASGSGGSSSDTPVLSNFMDSTPTGTSGSMSGNDYTGSSTSGSSGSSNAGGALDFMGNATTFYGFGDAMMQGSGGAAPGSNVMGPVGLGVSAVNYSRDAADMNQNGVTPDNTNSALGNLLGIGSGSAGMLSTAGYAKAGPVGMVLAAGAAGHAVGKAGNQAGKDRGDASALYNAVSEDDPYKQRSSDSTKMSWADYASQRGADAYYNSQQRGDHWLTSHAIGLGTTGLESINGAVGSLYSLGASLFGGEVELSSALPRMKRGD